MINGNSLKESGIEEINKKIINRVI